MDSHHLCRVSEVPSHPPCWWQLESVNPKLSSELSELWILSRDLVAAWSYHLSILDHWCAEWCFAEVHLRDSTVRRNHLTVESMESAPPWKEEPVPHTMRNEIQNIFKSWIQEKKKSRSHKREIFEVRRTWPYKYFSISLIFMIRSLINCLILDSPRTKSYRSCISVSTFAFLSSYVRSAVFSTKKTSTSFIQGPVKRIDSILKVQRNKNVQGTKNKRAVNTRAVVATQKETTLSLHTTTLLTTRQDTHAL